MFSAWGDSWGAAWGDAWGAIVAEPVNLQPQVWAGGDYREYRDYLAAAHGIILVSLSVSSISSCDNPTATAPDLPEYHASSNASVRLFPAYPGVVCDASVLWDSSASVIESTIALAFSHGCNSRASVVWDSSADVLVESVVFMSASGISTVDNKDDDQVLIAVAAYMLKRRRLARK